MSEFLKSIGHQFRPYMFPATSTECFWIYVIKKIKTLNIFWLFYPHFRSICYLTQYIVHFHGENNPIVGSLAVFNTVMFHTSMRRSSETKLSLLHFLMQDRLLSSEHESQFNTEGAIHCSEFLVSFPDFFDPCCFLFANAFVLLLDAQLSFTWGVGREWLQPESTFIKDLCQAGPCVWGNMKDAFLYKYGLFDTFSTSSTKCLHHAATKALVECFWCVHSESRTIVLEGMSALIRLIAL